MTYTPTIIICLIISVIIAYLLGSLNFAIIISKIVAHDDIRNHGSGNAGLTNVLRTLGKGPAAFTLLGDFSKGIIAVFISRLILKLVAGIDDFMLADYLVIYGALLGHVFPLYYGFKGGKGILVTFGILLVLSPTGGLICFGAFLLCVIFTRYVSLGSIVAGMVFPISIIIVRMTASGVFPGTEVLLSLPISILIIYMHRKNLVRLIKGTESKLSFKKK